MTKTKTLRIPLAFDEALSSLLQVKPPAKGEAAKKPKRTAKKRTTKKR